jgi:ABC-type lipoprotein export system ATPase subunit
MIVLEKVSKHYCRPTGIIKALDEIDLLVERNQFTVIRGPSGSGKTTLLLTIGGMLRPTSGHLAVVGMDPYGIDNKNRLAFRAEKIGFVFQLFHLIPYLNVIENVLLPAGSTGGGNKDLRSRARSLLEQMNLDDRFAHFPAELSAGEKQRTAIARAMLKKPEILLADEPTGNLDPENAAIIAGCLAEAHREGCTVIVVTHGRDCDPCAERIIRLEKGRLSRERE